SSASAVSQEDCAAPYRRSSRRVTGSAPSARSARLNGPVSSATGRGSGSLEDTPRQPRLPWHHQAYTMRSLPVRGDAVWQLVGLITRRSQVQILPPLPLLSAPLLPNAARGVSFKAQPRTPAGSRGRIPHRYLAPSWCLR